MKINPLNAADFYKFSHRNMYDAKASLLYSNFTPRSDKLANVLPDFDHKVVFFGLQAVVKWLLIDLWNREFFQQPKNKVVAQYKRRCDTSLGKDSVKVDHIEALHDLGYLPILIKALPEGSRVNIRVPVFTIQNTVPEFFWLTNYLETQLSAESWKVMHTATIAYEYRRLLDSYAELTGSPPLFVAWQGHDFANRGMSGIYDSSASLSGHLLSFMGTDTPLAIDYLENYYNADADKECIGGSVPACYDSITEILTQKGFVLFKDLTADDLVAEYDESGNIDFVKPSSYYNAPYKGDMVVFSSNGVTGKIDLVVTPNHRMVRRSFSTGKIEIQNAAGAVFSQRNMWIQAGKAVGENCNLTLMERLKIAFQADGSFPSRKESYTGERTGCFPIRFTLKKERKKERLELILNELGVEYTKTNDARKEGYSHYWIKLKEKLSKNFDWVDFKKINHEWCRSFIEEAAYWDASVKTNCVCYSSTVEFNIDVMQTIAILGGYRTSKSKTIDKRPNRKNIFVTVASRITDCRTGDGIQKSIISYDDTVHCVTVPTGMIVVRRNGVVSISGNTEHSVACMGILGTDINSSEFIEASKLFPGNDDNKLIGEYLLIKELITEKYPSGIISLVSDTFDFFRALSVIVPQLKKEILSRKPNELGFAKTVFRPDCYDEKTEILTENGWVKFPDLQKGVKVAQMHDDWTTDFVEPLKYIEQNYTGEMISLSGNKIDLLVTPNHRMIISDNIGRLTAREASKVSFHHKVNIPRIAPAKNEGINIKPYERFLIAFQADGSFPSGYNETTGIVAGHIRTRFNFQKKRKIERLKEICKDANLEYTIKVEPTRGVDLDQVTFYVNIPLETEIGRLLSKNFDWVNPSQRDFTWCDEFIRELGYWDGTYKKGGKGNIKYDTTIPYNAEIAQLVAIRGGWGCTYGIYIDNRSEKFSDVHSLSLTSRYMVNGEGVHKETVDFSGKVYCVQVPTGRLVVRRNRKVVVCGNSGNPVDIICGDPDAPVGSPEYKGAVECLWDVFGGTITETGHKLLDCHVGLIYGDSITLQRAFSILKGMHEKGFASANVVFGIGSFTYNFCTRDSFGNAMKATFGVVDGEDRPLFKEPKTDSGTKNSARGLLRVEFDGTDFVLHQDQTREQEQQGLLEAVFCDGKLMRDDTLSNIRSRLGTF